MAMMSMFPYGIVANTLPIQYVDVPISLIINSKNYNGHLFILMSVSLPRG